MFSYKEMFSAHCRNDERGLLVVNFVLVTDIASDAKTQQNLMKKAWSYERVFVFFVDISTIVFFSGE